ncbi:MAG TPA: MlaD family protein [Candidatus Sulfotelmatobacter sp.]|nr:MlaD family protein [Candidatus Sulfotelmatobacter sp.]
MSRRANPKVIGAFVVGAVGLIVVGVLALGSLQWFFERPVRVVMLFDGDVNGLTLGAPIAFRGVKLGQVTDIRIDVPGGGKIAVYGEIPPRILNEDAVTMISHAVQKGLRAELALQSLLTGQLYVGLKMMPDTSAKQQATDPHAIEIPTVPSVMQEWSTRVEGLLNKLAALPLDQLISSATGAMGGIEDFARSPEVRQVIRRADALIADIQGVARDARPMIASFTATSDTARSAVTDVAQDLRRLATNLEATSDVARGFLTDGQQLVRDVDAKVDPLASSLIGTLDKAQGTLANLDGVLTGRAALGYQLGQALQQITATARSVRALADYLDQHPEALLAGKGGPRGGGGN